jgi:hypothetical protein
VDRHGELWQSFMNYFKGNPDLFRGIKSLRFYNQTSGKPTGAFVQVVEFESLTEKEILDRRLENDQESIRFHEELQTLKDTSTVTKWLWEPADLKINT